MTKPATLVLLPGLDGTEIFFRPLLAALPSWVKPIVVTYPTDGGNDYVDLLGVVSAAVADVREYWVLGWSFSGPLALMLAAEEPQKTRGIILCASFVRPPRPGLTWFRFAAVGPVIWVLRVARRSPAFVFRFWSREFRRGKAETWARVSAWTLAARIRTILRTDARDLLRGCEKPVLYLAGSKDTVVPRRNAEEIAQGLPSTRIVTIDGPHFVLYTNPQAASDVISDMIRNGGSAQESKQKLVTDTAMLGE